MSEELPQQEMRRNRVSCAQVQPCWHGTGKTGCTMLLEMETSSMATPSPAYARVRVRGRWLVGSWCVVGVVE